MRIIIAAICFLFMSYNLESQSIFDKIENKLVNRLSISAGAQFTWYKDSNIYFRQDEYDRELTIHRVHATGRGRFNEFFKGRIGCSQFRVDVSYQLSEKYTFQIETTHLDYLVDLNQDYYQISQWDGNKVNETSDLTDKFTLLEHSNGINIWKLGLVRNFKFSKLDKISLVSGFQFGIVMTATQANIFNPEFELEMYDPGNNYAGFNYSFHSELVYHISSRVEVYFNWTYFQMNLKEAYINENSFVSQSISGTNSGVNIRYRI